MDGGCAGGGGLVWDCVILSLIFGLGGGDQNMDDMLQAVRPELRPRGALAALLGFFPAWGECDFDGQSAVESAEIHFRKSLRASFKAILNITFWTTSGWVFSLGLKFGMLGLSASRRTRRALKELMALGKAVPRGPWARTQAEPRGASRGRRRLWSYLCFASLSENGFSERTVLHARTQVEVSVGSSFAQVGPRGNRAAWREQKGNFAQGGAKTNLEKRRKCECSDPLLPCRPWANGSSRAEFVSMQIGWGIYSDYFLGLRPLAGQASLKLYHAMSCFLHEKRSVCYDMAG